MDAGADFGGNLRNQAATVRENLAGRPCITSDNLYRRCATHYALPEMHCSVFLRLRMEGLESLPVSLSGLRLHFDDDEYDAAVVCFRIDGGCNRGICHRHGGGWGLAAAAEPHFHPDSFSRHWLAMALFRLEAGKAPTWVQVPFRGFANRLISNGTSQNHSGDLRTDLYRDCDRAHSRIEA